MEDNEYTEIESLEISFATDKMHRKAPQLQPWGVCQDNFVCFDTLIRFLQFHPDKGLSTELSAPVLLKAKLVKAVSR